MIARTRWPVTLGWLCVVVIATVLGAAVPRLAPTPGLPATLLLAAAIALGLGLMASGPTSCIAAIAALAMLGAQTLTARVVGPVDIQVADIFYAVLVFWVIARPPTDVRRGSALTVPAAGIPTAGILVFIGYVGLTIMKIALVDPGYLEASMVSWLRLVQTASLIWLAAAAVRTTPEVRRVIRFGAIAVPSRSPAGKGCGHAADAAVPRTTTGLLEDPLAWPTRLSGSLGPMLTRG